jgi:hypothetical protein
MSRTKKGAYKPTGNIAVDMVAACIWHFEKQDIKLKAIRLDAIHWTMFTGFILEKIPMYDLTNGEVDFDDVIVTQGSVLQDGPMIYELPKKESKIYLLN